MFVMAEVLHYGPTDIDALTVEEFNQAVAYVNAAQQHAKAMEESGS